jgi:hypothetical protein
MKLLLSDALSTIAPQALPADSSKQTTWVNAVCQQFFGHMKFGGSTVRWKGTNAGASFQIFYDATGCGYFTLPRNLLSVLAAGYGMTTPGQPLAFNMRFSNAQVNGPWHEFGNGGYGVGDQVWGRGVFDAGDGFCVFQDFPDASTIRIVCETAELSGATMTFRGTDVNGNDIYTGSGSSTILGVNLDISTSLTTNTTQVFGSAPSLVKKPVTYGPVSLYAVSVATGVATLCAIYDPGDTSPGFRRYRLGGPTNTGQPIPFATVHAMCKRRFVPAVSMNDEVIPGSIPAIELGLQGRRYDLESDQKTASAFWRDAFEILNSELNEYQGGAVPNIIFQKGWSVAAMPHIN